MIDLTNLDTLFKIESYEEFQKALKQVVCSDSSNVQQTTEDPIFVAAKNDVQKIMLESDFDICKIPELLTDKGWDKEKTAFFLNILNQKKTELLYGYLNDQNSEYGEIVTNFNWNLKLVLGTSELNTLKYPLLQLILFTNNNKIHKKIMFDMNKEMLLKSINMLEKINECN